MQASVATLSSFNLADRARRALLERGFVPDFSPEVAAEINRIRSSGLPAVEDYTKLFWSSIDNEDSRDLDQIEYAERAPDDSIRLLVGLADVATSVRPGGPIDRHAHQNTVSLYTPGHIFPLLPPQLSTGMTSLLPDQPRLAVIVEMLIVEDGEIHNSKIYPALVQNQAKLAYESVGEFLEGRNNSPQFGSAELREQITLQLEAARRLITLRHKMGALTFSSNEAQPVTRDGEVVDLKLVTPNRARDLIESFMIAANVATATFLKSRGFPILERVVDAPRRWDRICQIAAQFGLKLPDQPAPKPLSDFLAARRVADPQHFRDLSLTVLKLLGPGEYRVEYPNGPQSGHFGLALDDYSHSTAPNRRFADIVLQRLLFAAFQNSALPYSNSELEEIAAHCTEREDAARKVERLMRKVAAAYIMRDRIGQTFSAIVTGASPKGTYVRLQAPPVEGRIIRGEGSLDVGDRINVRLLSVDPECGFIDFARV
ncbi:MAG TPA: RNB domain-containing ribonuclease [Verrucomicrobiae bacterium]|jgi:exoribonuclease-2|nr:RNB domain-containing ribonuclease [Verrucomicrobiae bacterium]